MELNIVEEARRVFDCEIRALEASSAAIDHRFEKIVELVEKVHNAGGKLIFCGLGKNVFIARKISATFNSTGVSATFLDPVAALHGDVGICKEGDLAFLFSNSGSTEEVLAVVAPLKRLGAVTIAVTKEVTSPLGKNCDYILPYEVPAEADVLKMVPTSSTTAELAMGDALAMVFLKKRGFTPEDFAKFHPSGTIGKSLLLRVADVMRARPNIAVVSDGAKIVDVVLEIATKKSGLAVIVDEAGKLVGCFSDGDLKRLLPKNQNCLNDPIAVHMTRNPKTIQSELLAVEAVRRFEQYPINQLIVVDEYGFPVGVVDIQDLPKLKLV
jgi:arabinose-5-phosphate isomerase